MKNVLWGLSLALVANAAVAADVDGNFAIDGIGGKTCADFSAVLAEDNTQLINAYISWMSGFVSSYNMSAAETYDVTPWQTTELQLLKLGAFCEKNPEAPYYVAVNGLVKHLDAGKLAKAEDLVSIKHGETTVLIYTGILERVRATLMNEGKTVPETGFDGTFAEALQAYQTEHELEATGIPDLATLNAMFP